MEKEIAELKEIIKAYEIALQATEQYATEIQGNENCGMFGRYMNPQQYAEQEAYKESTKAREMVNGLVELPVYKFEYKKVENPNYRERLQ